MWKLTRFIDCRSKLKYRFALRDDPGRNTLRTIGKTGKSRKGHLWTITRLGNEIDENLNDFSNVVKVRANLVPRSHSVTGNVRSGKVREYTIFHWPLKKGSGNAIYAPIGLFRGAVSEGLVFASSCAVLNKCQLCGGKFCFFPTPEKLYS